MQAVCVQPPFVQLNTPYPAIWYLDAWFRNTGMSSMAMDHSISVSRSIFCRSGLSKVFQAARQALQGRTHPDAETHRRITGYLDQEASYLRLIDSITGFMAGQDPAFAYRLSTGAAIPLGMRAEAVLGEAGGIAASDALALATAILNDLSDFISYALDPEFGMVRYAEHLATGAHDFAEILAAAHSGWVINEFYRPLLRDCFARTAMSDDTILLCLTVPFPGCLAGAVAAAETARSLLGKRATILLGGGYVSTELRFLDDPQVFDLFDYLCYDSAYESIRSILAVLAGAPETALHRVRYRNKAGQVRACGFPAVPSRVTRPAAAHAAAPRPMAISTAQPAAIQPGSNSAPDNDWRQAETLSIATVHPDYLGADFPAYLRIVDSPNPMHRLWNDTPWLKYRLAYGCYWQRCAFCDTQLDYIKRYIPSDIAMLMHAADTAASRTKLYGIHFVDEAMPVNLVRKFAGLNLHRQRPFTFWGNARFDRAWNTASCAMAAEGGLVAVSGGIEIATAPGLRIVDKGFSLTDLVRSLLAFKQAGILVHGYLIYGFPGQTDQDIADSAEMVRVLLAEGLVDSAFWHKFVLTRHSSLYARWERGEVPDLRPHPIRSRFAINDLRFAGETASERWTAPLDAALTAWAEDGAFDKPLQAFLPKGLPRPGIDTASVLKDAGL